MEGALRVRKADTVLREREADFRTLADNLPILCWIAEADGSVYWFNRRWYEYTGATSEQSLGWAWRSAHDPAILPEVLERWRGSLAGEVPFEMVFPLRGGDDIYRPFLTRAVPVRKGSGSAVRWFGTNTDISGQRAAEERLGELNETLEHRVATELAQRLEAERSVRQLQKTDAFSRLPDGIAHDFNNTMAVVISSLNLLERRLAKGDTDVAKYIRGAIDGATRASAFTRQLLAFSRQQALAPEPIDLNRAVKSMTEALTRTLGEKIRLETDLASEELQINADVGEFENSLLSLSANARDAMASGGKLTIKTAPASIDQAAAKRWGIAVGDYVTLTVSGAGSGMAPEVFERALGPTTKGFRKGTALGLSQMFGFVGQSDGHVEVHSEEGGGTSVKIYLPRIGD
jgi:PAS domain S-box-containing protein